MKTKILGKAIAMFLVLSLIFAMPVSALPKQCSTPIYWELRIQMEQTAHLGKRQLQTVCIISKTH